MRNLKKVDKVFALVLIFLCSLTILFGSGVKINDSMNSLKGMFHPLDSEKRLIYGCADDAISLDPAITNEMESYKVTVNILETLVKYEEEGSRIIPCLAESWKSSEDGLTWVFRLRRDVKFHDGTDFDAHAVEFNFHRWMDADSPYHIGQFSYWNYIFSGFPGFVKSVTAISDYSLEVVLTKPYTPFLSAMAMPVFGIASPDAIKKYNEELYKHPVGTGPFTFKSWEMGKSIILERNDKYWGEVAKLDEVEFRVIQSSKERIFQLGNGTIQMTDNLNAEDVDEVKRDTKFRLYLRPSFNVGYLAMNNEKPPFNKREVRVAISYAIDKENLIRDIFSDLAKPANTLLPPVLWGHNENIKSTYNPNKAKEILKEAGYEEGFKTTLWVMDSARAYFPKPIQVAEFIKENLKQVNIDAEIKILNWNDYLDKAGKGEHELLLMGWTGDIIDPDNFLNTLLSSDNAKPGLAGNYSFYKNDDVDHMLLQARQTINMDFRKNLYRKLQETVYNDMPSVPLVHTMPAIALRWNVKGYTPHLTGVESLEQIYIEDIK